MSILDCMTFFMTQVGSYFAITLYIIVDSIVGNSKPNPSIDLII